MQAYETLPEGYQEIYKVNLQENKRLAFWLNAAALVVALFLMFLPSSQAGYPWDIPLSMWLIILPGIIVYTVLHELVHGIAMKCVGTKKVTYGFTGLYAFAGSKDWYDKSSYISIALAPIIVLGAVLAVIQCLVPPDWFWLPWMLQISNISGACGDIFCTVKFLSMPKDILIIDCGIGMSVYSRSHT